MKAFRWPIGTSMNEGESLFGVTGEVFAAAFSRIVNFLIQFAGR